MALTGNLNMTVDPSMNASTPAEPVQSPALDDQFKSIKRLRRSRWRWRITTACLTAMLFYFMSHGGSILKRERAQIARVAVLEQELAEAKTLLQKAGVALQRSKDMLLAAGQQLNNNAAANVNKLIQATARQHGE